MRYTPPADGPAFPLSAPPIDPLLAAGVSTTAIAVISVDTDTVAVGGAGSGFEGAGILPPPPVAPLTAAA
jgi:hypothetical protein